MATIQYAQTVNAQEPPVTEPVATQPEAAPQAAPPAGAVEVRLTSAQLKERLDETRAAVRAATDELTAPGSFAAVHVAGSPVVLTRDRDDVVRAFANVCRHRGAVVASGAGERGTLQCPYHAWTYGLDGCLRAAPRTSGMTQ